MIGMETEIKIDYREYDPQFHIWDSAESCRVRLQIIVKKIFYSKEKHKLYVLLLSIIILILFVKSVKYSAFGFDNYNKYFKI